jgi:hypothetical protein
MGNGQNRNRRGGARTRHGQHRGGAAAGDRRGATHVMPPTLVPPSDAAAGAETDAGAETPSAAEIHEALDEAQAAEIAEEQFERAAGELREGPQTQELEQETAPGIEVASAAAAPPPVSATSTPPDAPVAPLAPPSATRPPATDSAPAASVGETPPVAPPEEQDTAQRAENALDTASAEPERPAPRGRFERFYAPGQGSHPERNGHGGAGANGAANSATRRPMRDTLRDPLHDPGPTASPPAAPVPEEEEMPPSGPREDVRGAVGGLIDALHELFTQDRAVATQGGSSRCGLCYLHFPIGELVYRESEGFYVCQACERALGSARVNMVRRQQKL